MCPTRHFVHIFFNPVFQLSTAKNEINLFNNHILIVAPVTFAPAGAMTPSVEFLCFFFLKDWLKDILSFNVLQTFLKYFWASVMRGWGKVVSLKNCPRKDDLGSIIFSLRAKIVLMSMTIWSGTLVKL